MIQNPEMKDASRMPPFRALVVIPTYNNRATLRKVAEGALSFGYDVLVVNDGSTDGGPGTLDGLSVRRLDFPENRGKGAAIREAAAWAEKNGFSHLITLDADGQHDPAEIPKFIQAAREFPLSIVIGHRLFRREEVPFKNRFGRRFSNFWVKLSSGAGVPDSQCGFRVYPVEALRRIRCRADRYDFEVEILVRSVWAGLPLQSVDISVRYDREMLEASHFRPWVDNLRISRTYAGLVIRNFIPLPHRTLFGITRNQKLKVYFLNPLRTLKTLATEKTGKKEVSFAVFLGIFLGTLPLIATHSVVIVFVATRLRLNRLIALNVSNFCAPPLVPAMAIEAGYFLRHGRFLTEFTMETLGRQVLQRFSDYLLGSVVIAPVLAGAAALLAFVLASLTHKTVSHVRRAQGRRSGRGLSRTDRDSASFSGRANPRSSQDRDSASFSGRAKSLSHPDRDRKRHSNRGAHLSIPGQNSGTCSETGKTLSRTDRDSASFSGRANPRSSQDHCRASFSGKGITHPGHDRKRHSRRDAYPSIADQNSGTHSGGGLSRPGHQSMHSIKRIHEA